MVCTLVPVAYWKLQGGKLRVSEWRKGQSGGIYGDTDRGIVPEQDERPKVSESSLERASGSSAAAADRALHMLLLLFIRIAVGHAVIVTVRFGPGTGTGAVVHYAANSLGIHH